MPVRWFPLILPVLACAIAASSTQTASAAYDEATASQVSPGHTGFASGGSLDRPPLVQRWTRVLGTSTSYPLIADGRVFTVTRDDDHAGSTVVALDAGTGITLWSRPLAGDGRLAYDDDRVFVSEDSGAVSAVSPVTGALLWTTTVAVPFALKEPVAADGALYVESGWNGGALYALAESDGARQWTASVSGNGMPSIDRASVYLSDDHEGGMTAISRADGLRTWQLTKDCFVASGRTVADGARAVGPYSSSCGSFEDAATGRTLDTVSSSAPPAIAGDMLVTLNGTILQGRSLSTGVLAWEYGGDGGLTTAPLIVNETVYVGSTTGVLHAVDLRTGAPVWSGAIFSASNWASYQTGKGTLAAADGILVATGAGRVTALESQGMPRAGLDLRIETGPDGPTRATSADFTFGSTSVAPEECRLDQGPWHPCSGSESIAALADGPHVFEVRTLDALNGTTVALATRGWSVDSVVPSLAITKGPAPIGNATTIDIKVDSDDPYARLSCRLDGADWGSCLAPTDTYTPTGGREFRGLADGEHTLEARAKDAVGNTPGVVARTFTIDTKPPATTISGGPQGATTDTSASFTFDADEPATFRCSLDSAPTAPCLSPYELADVPTGTHTLRVYATDTAGNKENGAGAMRTWTVSATPPDTIAPETSIVNGPPGHTPSPTARLTFTSSEPGTAECRLDGAPWRYCFSPADVVGLADGDHTWEVRGLDASGNTDPTPASWSWTVDSRPPVTSASRTSSGSFAFAADEPASYECTLDSSGWAPCASGTTYPDVPAGDHVFAVRATDLAGNVEPQPASVPFTVAADSPVIPGPVEPAPVDPAPVDPAPIVLAPVDPIPHDPAPGPADAPVVAPILRPVTPGTVTTTPDATTARVPVAVSVMRELAASYARELGRIARAKLRRNLVLEGLAPDAGVLLVTVRDAPSRTLLASGRKTVNHAGAVHVRVKPTRAGRRAHRARRRVRIGVTFKPRRGSTARATKTTTLR